MVTRSCLQNMALMKTLLALSFAADPGSPPYLWNNSWETRSLSPYQGPARMSESLSGLWSGFWSRKNGANLRGAGLLDAIGLYHQLAPAMRARP